MGHRIRGCVKHEGSGKGVSGLQVRAFPVGWIDREDCLGNDTTGRNGEFSIILDDNALRNHHHIDSEIGHEIAIRVTKPSGWLVNEIRRFLETGQDWELEIFTSPSDLGGEHVISGTVYDARSGNPLCNMTIEVWDEDFVMDDFLGSAKTDRSGHYRVSFVRDEFCGVLDINPDVYIIVKNQNGTVLHRSSTRKETARITIIDAQVGGIELAGMVSDGFYRWRTLYSQEGTHVSVRIRLVPDDDITNDELVLLREKWKKGIEEIWSGRFVCCSESDASAPSDCSRPTRLTFEVCWVDKNPHYTLRVRKGPAVSNMLLWDTEDSEAVVAHHFGHMLGLVDEYYDPCCPSRVLVSTGTIMDDGTSIVRRQANRFCQFVNQHAVAVPHLGLSGDLIPDTPQAGASPEQTTNEVISRLLKSINAGKTKLGRGDRIVHRVSGGVLGDRYEWFVEILHSGLVSHGMRDEIRGIEESHSTSLDSSSMMRLINRITATGVSKTRPSDHGYLPDSLVGCFTLHIGGLQSSWSFLASPTQRKAQRCRMGKEIAAANRLMMRVAAIARAGE